MQFQHVNFEVGGEKGNLMSSIFLLQRGSMQNWSQVDSSTGSMRDSKRGQQLHSKQLLSFTAEQMSVRLEVQAELSMNDVCDWMVRIAHVH